MQVKGGPSVYFTGDTAAGTIFDTIRRRLGAPTLALLPIGAYRPDWIRTHHTNPADAVQVFRQLQAQQAIACHFGTWQLADEGYQETLGDLATALREAGIPPHLFPAPDNGQTLRGSAH
jgi:L-ascorbate metabolism protein UlaG (beta-lactamase superfamily)